MKNVQSWSISKGNSEMPDVVLLYDPDCPNVISCRTNLIKAFSEAGKQPSWREVDRRCEDTPLKLTGFGSPTILVDGIDVGGERAGSGGASCRLYRVENGGYAGAPSVNQIAALLRDTSGPARNAVPTNGRQWGKLLAALPPVGLALLPNVTCPACWPAYAAVLSSLGIGFLPSNRYVFPLTIAFLTFYLGLLAWDARKRRRCGPLALGGVASIVLVASRFVVDSETALYAGIGFLVTASIWNGWPTGRRRRVTSGSCPAWEAVDEGQGVGS